MKAIEYQQKSKKSKIFRNHYFGYLNYGNIKDSYKQNLKQKQSEMLRLKIIRILRTISERNARKSQKLRAVMIFRILRIPSTLRIIIRILRTVVNL